MDLGRVAGLVYLGASVLFVSASTLRARIFVSDPGTTLENVRSSEMMARAVMAAEVASFVLFLLTAMLLYALLGETDRLAAGAMVVFAAIGTTLGCAAVANELALLNVATQDPVGSLGTDATAQLVALFSGARRSLLVLTDLTSGLWLLPMGYLVMRSGSIPAVLGALLIVGGVAWLARLFVQLLAPDLSGLVSLLPAGSIGELLLMAWLIVTGGERLMAGAPGVG